MVYLGSTYPIAKLNGGLAILTLLSVAFPAVQVPEFPSVGVTP